MAVNDTSELIVSGTLNVGGSVQSYIHTLHFRHLSIPVGGSPEQIIIDRWQAAARTTWLAIHQNNYSMVELICRQVCGSLPLRSSATEADPATGSRTTATGDQLASWLSAVVTEYTDLAGRTRRGRFFVSGAFEGDINGNTWQSGYLTLVNAYNTALLGAFGPSGTDADLRLVVHSRKEASKAGTQCQDSSRIVTRLVTRSTLTTQRSRRPRVFA